MWSDVYKRPDFKLFRFSAWHLVIPVIIGVIVTIFSYPQAFLSVKIMAFVLVYSLAIGIPSMKSFEYIEWKLEQHVSWLKRPGRRFFLTAFMETLVGIIILGIVNWLIYIVIQKQEIDIMFSKTTEGLKYLIIFTINGVVLINSSFFLRSWRRAVVNEERLKREKLLIEYEALKNQVNPHFFFNSLTALSSLVYKDQRKAELFIREFSNVFRYVLDNREKEVIDFATERKQLESVSFMYRIRYEDSLQVNIKLSHATDKYVIPMALQMLMENAIKHNALSDKKPLVVDVVEEEGYVVVRNNLQPKMTEIVSNKIGLENIISRYRYLSDKEVLVEMTDESFVVKIPVLKTKNV